MSTPVNYADAAGLGEIKWYRRPVERRGMMHLAPGQALSGYGMKITSDYIITFGDDKRKYRVYVVCYSNVGSMYVTIKGKRLYMRNEPDSKDIPDEDTGK